MKQFRDTYYNVSEDGQVINSKTGRYLSLKIRKETKSTFQRVYVQLQINKEQKQFSLSRVVAEVYIPNPNNLPQVNHIDGNPLNNHYLNLEWVTQSENIIHAVETRLKPMLGEDNTSSKLTKQQVITIRNEYSKGNISLRKLAENYKVSYTTIRYIIINKTWKCVISGS